MTTSSIENKKRESEGQLKNRVEQSVALLCEEKVAAENRPIASRPIASRRSALPIHMDTAYLQKGALVDAANALAALWKVPSRAKLPNRTLQYSR